MKPAIVVAAYNRPNALHRMLHSLLPAHIPPDVPLIIPIDPGGTHQLQVEAVAHAFEWPHGEKRVIIHEQHLGLVQNMYFTGSLTREFGSIIRFEDDYFASPVFYDYASQALDYYADDDRIAGISLYSLWFNGFNHQPFTPYLDCGSVYFMQNPWSHGQAFTASQWDAYTQWRAANGEHISLDDPIHEVYTRFDADDWFPLATRYLASTGRFYVFPREAVSTNFGDVGTHFIAKSRYFQVPIQTIRREFHFHPLDEAVAGYDSFQEMLPDRIRQLNPSLADYDFAVDLNGEKTQSKIDAPYVLTTKLCRDPIRSWGCELHPREANIALNTPGVEISLCRTEDIRTDRFSRWQMRRRHYAYTQARYAVSVRERLMFRLIGLLDQFGIK